MPPSSVPEVAPTRRPIAPRSTLTFTTWLAPGLPKPMFDQLGAVIAEGLNLDHVVDMEPKMSGPLSPETDRFAQGLTDIGFVCPPSFSWLVGGQDPSVVLVPRAPVYTYAASSGTAVYYSEVVVRADSGMAEFGDLAGRRVGYNDGASLSGFVSVLDRLVDDGRDPGWFGTFKCVGSHRTALELIRAGDIDAAAIDINVYHSWQHEHPTEAAELVSIATLGPYPVQPIVLRTGLAPALLDSVTAQLDRPEATDAVREFGIVGFAPVNNAVYEELEQRINRAMQIA